MPGPWVQGEFNPKWLASQAYAVKPLIEFVGYDDAAQAQGKVLASVEDTMERNDDGCWLAVKIRCVEDKDLAWWLTDGPGAKMKGNFFLHLCKRRVRDCKKFQKKEIAQFHTDTLRVVSLRDVEARAAGWWTEKTAKAEFEAFRASVVKAPVEKTPPPCEAELSFDPSDLDEEMEKLEQAGKEQRRAAQGDLSAKLARLKAESAPAGATPKKRRRLPSSAKPRGGGWGQEKKACT